MAPTVDVCVSGRPRSMFENVNIKDGFCGPAAGLDGQGEKGSDSIVPICLLFLYLLFFSPLGTSKAVHLSPPPAATPSSKDT